MSELLPFANHLQKIMKIYQFPLINNSKPLKMHMLSKQEPSLPQLTYHKNHEQSPKKYQKYHRVKTEQQTNYQQVLSNMQLQQRPIFNVVKNRSPQQLQEQLIKLSRRRQFSQKVIKPSISSTKIQTYTEVQIKQDKLKHPHKYQILSDENGFSDQKVYKMKDQQLNFQLEQFTKVKGKQYFQNMTYQLRSENKNLKAKSTLKTSLDSSCNNQLSKKYPNYIPEVFADAKLKKKKQKKAQQKKQKKKQPIKPVINQKLYKLKLLSEKEEMLGKVVFDEVKKHFNDEKKQENKYFSRVKSEQHIDDALIQFLKTKIDRAQVQLT